MRSYRKFNKSLIFIFLCSISYCFSVAGQEKKFSLTNDINNILNESRKEFNLPGVSLALKLPGSDEIRNYVSGNSSLSSNRQITPTTLFQIGSITKTFTATIIFKLIEENKLKSNDRLGKWLPQYARWNNITIYDLLHHTSGVYNYTHGKSFDDLLRKGPNKYWSLEKLANIAYKHPDLSLPGKKFNYTNTDYILLGMIIEKATNQSIQKVFDRYLKQYDLKDTFYSPSNYPRLTKNRIAHGYNRDGTFKWNTDVTLVSMSYNQSAGAMVSTPNDLIKWLNALFAGKMINNQSLKDMTTIISPNSAKLISVHKFRTFKNTTSSARFVELGAGAGIGLVYFKNNGPTWAHAGGTPGYESFFAYSPCNGIYLALTYNVKPKKQLIFIEIANKIFNKINNATEVIKAVQSYQRHNVLPEYCNIKMSDKNDYRDLT